MQKKRMHLVTNAVMCEIIDALDKCGAHATARMFANAPIIIVSRGVDCEICGKVEGYMLDAAVLVLGFYALTEIERAGKILDLAEGLSHYAD